MNKVTHLACELSDDHVLPVLVVPVLNIVNQRLRIGVVHVQGNVGELESTDASVNDQSHRYIWHTEQPPAQASNQESNHASPRAEDVTAGDQRS